MINKPNNIEKRWAIVQFVGCEDVFGWFVIPLGALSVLNCFKLSH